MGGGILAIHVVAVLLAIPLWRRVGKDAGEQGFSRALAWGLVLLFGLFGAYAFSILVDARVRGRRAGGGWAAAGLLAALAALLLAAARVAVLPAVLTGLAAWGVFHLVYLGTRRRLTVDAVLGRAQARGVRSSIEGELLRVEGLTKHFPVKRGLMNRTVGAVRAVDGINFSVRSGETLGLVGESGCGKTTTGRLLLRLLSPTAGSIRYRGLDLARLTEAEMRAMRKEIQIIFQDPYSSLNPRLTVESMLREALAIHGLARGQAAGRRVGELLDMVGLSSFHARRYPHEFSGGQRQRLGIARALAVEPRLLVCDEPVSALDVSIQAQIVNLLMDLQKRLGLTYLFIAHDLNVVEHLSDRVAVMYLGKIVELAERDQIYGRPRHPYTQALLSAVPVADPELRRERVLLAGDVPSPIHPPSGCAFHPRCPEARPECAERAQLLAEVEPGHLVACHRVHDLPVWSPATVGIDGATRGG